MLSEANLHAYQWKMINAILYNSAIAQWVDMGLGKTVSTLTAIKYLIGIGEVKKVLIVAPLRVALNTWPTEIKSWQHLKDLPFDNLAGKPQKRRSVMCMTSEAKIHIINVDLISWLIKFYGPKWPYDMIVLDEASLFKSSESKRFKNLAMILYMAKVTRLVQLTGTPTSKGLTDLWSQVFLLDKGKRLGTSYSSFIKKYFHFEEYSRKTFPKNNAEEEIYEAVNDITIRLTSDDYLKMPKRIENIVSVQLPKKAQMLYEDLETEYLLELEGDEVTAAFAAARTTKLCQLANGAIYTGEAGDTFWRKVHDAKLDALDEIVGEAMGAPILVAYTFKSDKERILAKFPNAQTLDDENAQERWNAGDIPMLLAHPKSAGHGLNLQHGGNIIVWFGPNWSLELTQQFNARLYRQGQKKPVFIHTIVAQGTVDYTILDSLAGKFKTQDDLLRAIKSR